MRTRTGTLISNPLYRLLAVNFLIGAGVAALIVAGMLVTDTGGLGTLIANTEAPAIAAALLYCGFLITFSSVAMGWAIMRIGMPEHPRGIGGLGIPAGVQPSLVPVRVRRRR